MTTFTVVGLSTEGFAIVAADTFERVTHEYDRLLESSNDRDDDSTEPDAEAVEAERELVLRAEMVTDLPEVVLDEFELIIDTRLDGALGLVMGDQLDAVIARLQQLGHDVA